ncbi:MAG: T9SS type A sorting domain-containing protein [Bacteroidales bacterium]
MRKGLLSIAAGLVISAGASAQYNPDLWVVTDETQNVQSLTGFTPDNGYSLDRIGGDEATYTTSFDDEGNLQVEFTNVAKKGAQYSDFRMGWYQWELDIEQKFETDTAGDPIDSDIMRGFTVDFKDDANREIELEVKADNDLTLRADLIDIAGKTSNQASPKANVVGDGEWQWVAYSWGGSPEISASVEVIEDTYTGDWWNVKKIGEEGEDNYLRGGSNNTVPMDTSHIIGVAFVVDDAGDGEPDDEKTLWIRNMKVGAADNPTTYEMWVDVPTVDGDELEVKDGIVYSAGTISVMNVTGQEVASAEGELDISTIPAGVYIIVTPEGTAKVVLK